MFIQVAAFDMNDPKAVVSPGGVGFDINCGVRLVRAQAYVSRGVGTALELVVLSSGVSACCVKTKWVW